MWVTELFSTRDRFVPVAMVHHGWSLGMVLISLLAYLFRSWRHLHLVVMAFCFTAIPLYLVLPESLYWLVRNKRNKQTAAIMSSIEQRDCFVGLRGNNPIWCFKSHAEDENEDDDFVNKKTKEQLLISELSSTDSVTTPVDSEQLTVTVDSEQTQENGKLNCEVPENHRTNGNNSELVVKKVRKSSDGKSTRTGFSKYPRKHSKTYWICLVLCSSFWFIDGLLYYGLQFSSAELSGDRFLNFFLLSAVELPAIWFAFILGKFTSRRFSLLFLHVFCGAAMATSSLLRFTKAIENSSDSTKTAVFNSLNITTKFFVTACFSVLVYVPAELFPTNVRNTSFNVNASFSRVAAIIGTFMPLMVRSDPATLECVLGFMGIFAGLTVFLLPESKNYPLPQTMDDLDAMARRTGSIFKMNY